MGDNNRGNTIFLSVIGIATLLVAIIGATFAYFATTISGDAADVNATTAKVGGVSFVAEPVAENNTAILPGWTSTAKTITVTTTPTEVDMAYSCYLDVSANAITDMRIKAVTLGDGTTAPSADGETGVTIDATANGKVLGTTANKIKLFDGKVKASTSTDTVQKVTYEIELPETGTNQTDANANAKVLSATVYCTLAGSTVYYNHANPGGTTTGPTAPTGA